MCSYLLFFLFLCCFWPRVQKTHFVVLQVSSLFLGNRLEKQVLSLFAVLPLSLLLLLLLGAGSESRVNCYFLRFCFLCLLVTVSEDTLLLSVLPYSLVLLSARAEIKLCLYFWCFRPLSCFRAQAWETDLVAICCVFTQACKTDIAAIRCACVFFLLLGACSVLSMFALFLPTLLVLDTGWESRFYNIRVLLCFCYPCCYWAQAWKQHLPLFVALQPCLLPLGTSSGSKLCCCCCSFTLFVASWAPA